MRTVPLAVAKAKLSRLVDDVGSADDALTITRHGVPAAVLLSPAEFESWQETLAIRGDPALVREIRRGLHPDLKRRVRAALDRLVADPSTGKALRAELTGLRSLRVGRIRVVYRESPDAIVIGAVGPRDRLYEETLRLVRREHQRAAPSPRAPARRAGAAVPGDAAPRTSRHRPARR